jgi:hypothetical protein
MVSRLASRSLFAVSDIAVFPPHIKWRYASRDSLSPPHPPAVLILIRQLIHFDLFGAPKRHIHSYSPPWPLLETHSAKRCSSPNNERRGLFQEFLHGKVMKTGGSRDDHGLLLRWVSVLDLSTNRSQAYAISSSITLSLPIYTH